MKRSERQAQLKSYIENQLINALKNGYPKAIATSDGCYLPRDISDAERIDAYNASFDRALAKVSKSNLSEILDEYMDLEGHLYFFLNWTQDKSGTAKECINTPFYEFIEAMQNLEIFENYYVAYKMPTKGQVSHKDKRNIRVDVITRY